MPTKLNQQPSRSSMLLESAKETGHYQIENQGTVHLHVELEVEVVQALVVVAELRLLMAAVEQPFASACQFVGDQRGDQVDGRHAFRLCLLEACFQRGHHAAQPQLMQGAIEFNQIHAVLSSKSMRCWIRSRYSVSSRIRGSIW